MVLLNDKILRNSDYIFQERIYEKDLIRLNMNIDYHSQLTFRQAVHSSGYNLYHINRHFQPKLSLRTEKAGSLFRGFRA